MYVQFVFTEWNCSSDIPEGKQKLQLGSAGANGKRHGYNLKMPSTRTKAHSFANNNKIVPLHI